MASPFSCLILIDLNRGVDAFNQKTCSLQQRLNTATEDFQLGTSRVVFVLHVNASIEISVRLLDTHRSCDLTRHLTQWHFVLLSPQCTPEGNKGPLSFIFLKMILLFTFLGNM